MIEHVVALKLADANKVESLNKAIVALSKVKGVTEVSCSPTFVCGEDRLQGYNYALRVSLVDRKALEAYAKDPEHLMVKKDYIVPALDKTKEKPVLALDWEAHPSGSRALTTMSFGLILGFSLGCLVTSRLIKR